MTKRPAITAAMQLALWKEHGQVVCAHCGDTVDDWNMNWDHWLALVDGGAHEVDNLRPVCLPCHKEKSAHEHRENARAKRRAKKHSNPTPPGKIKSRGFDKTVTRGFDGKVKRSRQP